MDLSDFFTEPLIKDYLKDFPSSEWKSILKKTLMYGIYSLKALEVVGIFSKIPCKVPNLNISAEEFKNSCEDRRETIYKNPAIRSTSHTNITKKNCSNVSCRNSNRRRTKKDKSSERPPPKKLVGREIETVREGKQKSENILGFKQNKVTYYGRIFDKDETSSLSTFNAPEEMQKVFKQDFGKKVLSHSIPKVLQPSENKVQGHHHNFSSISAE